MSICYESEKIGYDENTKVKLEIHFCLLLNLELLMHKEDWIFKKKTQFQNGNVQSQKW